MLSRTLLRSGLRGFTSSWLGLPQKPLSMPCQTPVTICAAPTPSRGTFSAFSTSLQRLNIPKPVELDEAESQVWDILASEFSPTALLVRDVSGGCGSMYAIEIASAKFAGLSVLKQQRLVNAALGDLVKSWHGLQLRTRAA
ncbi:hypothetical protein Cpir12675_003364 [Ceratocystis pirilliformis]|uniref:Altered inheritance of mitochondria protein 1 n=1 Tax=Ceratocystis pirilliformis TaxID=259994 RepID=A0ABR3Z3D2_9PEZI